MAITSAVKDMNIAMVKGYMKQNVEASKSEIARGTGLSIPTVTRIVDSMCMSGELIDKGLDKMTGGRSASIYARNTNYSLCLLIRIEGRHLNWVIKNLDGEIVRADHRQIDQELIRLLDELILGLEKEYANLKAVVIGISAMVINGRVEQTKEFTNLLGVNIPLHFKNLTDIPVQLENDMNAIAMGQWYQSKVKTTTTVCLYFGENGMGAGTIHKGEVWYGTSNFSGELVFMPYAETKFEYMTENIDKVNIVEFYVKLIQIYAVTLNPDQIVLYSNDFIDNRVHEIRDLCYKRLPINAIPHIEYSNEFKQDYEKGLFALAQKLID